MIPREVIADGEMRARVEKLDAQLPQVNVPYIQQQRNTWCWAACVQMVVAVYQARFPTQCELANMAFNRLDCCNLPTPGACDQGYNDIDRLFIRMQFNIRNQANPLAPNVIAGQIQAGHPIIYKLTWLGAPNDHVGVISDIRFPPNRVPEVYFLDPDANYFAGINRAPFGWVDITYIYNAYNNLGNWTTTWFDIEQ